MGVGFRFMPRSEEQQYDASPERVYSAALKAIAELGYSVIGSDSQSGIVSFNTGMSWRSWSGQNMTITVIGDLSLTRVAVTGGLAKKGTIVTGGQLTGWGEKGAVTRRFLEALDRAIENTPEPAAQGSARHADTVAELGRLVDLHKTGALTDEEFAAAKAKTLGT